MVVSFELAAVIAFFSLVGVLLWIDRKNIEFNYGLIIRRWKKGQYVMDKWIFSHRKFLDIVGTIGVVIGFAALVGGLAAIVYFTTQNQQAISPILPTVGEFQYPTGVVGVPFWFWLIGIFVILTVHEPMHAIFARLAGIPVRSWGILTFLVLPIGAFVDPDMKKISKLKLMQKLKIFAGGSLGNFATAALIFGLMTLVSSALLQGITFEIPGSEFAAGDANLPALVSINGAEIGSYEDVVAAMDSVSGGQSIRIVTEDGSFNTVTTSTFKNSLAIYGNGVGAATVAVPQYSNWILQISTLHQLLLWLFIFNLGVGIANMLPMKPFDGGHMIESIFTKFLKSEKLAKTATLVTSLVVLAIILINVFGTNIINSLVG